MWRQHLWQLVRGNFSHPSACTSPTAKTHNPTGRKRNSLDHILSLSLFVFCFFNLKTAKHNWYKISWTVRSRKSARRDRERKDRVNIPLHPPRKKQKNTEGKKAEQKNWGYKWNSRTLFLSSATIWAQIVIVSLYAGSVWWHIKPDYCGKLWPRTFIVGGPRIYKPRIIFFFFLNDSLTKNIIGLRWCCK